MLVVSLVEEHILSVCPVRGVVLEDSFLIDAVLRAELFPKLHSDWTTHRAHARSATATPPPSPARTRPPKQPQHPTQRTLVATLAHLQCDNLAGHGCWFAAPTTGVRVPATFAASFVSRGKRRRERAFQN